MISITCTHCKTVLTIDDAFAGGACRCQHCGTIQTVPIQLKNAATATPYVNPSVTHSKALYQNKNAAKTAAAGGAVATSSPSGLDDLAQAVHSSGLAGSGLRGSDGIADHQPMPITPQAQAAGAAVAVTVGKKKSLMLPMMFGGGAVAVVVIAVVAFLALHTGTGSSTGGSGGSASPEFCGAPLTGATSVIYVLDRGSSIRDDFDAVKAATFQSITTLGADRKFAIVLWNNEGDDVAFPAEGMRNATSDQIELSKGTVGSVMATGASHLRGALERAAARQPSAIVIATAKSKFEDDDVTALSNFKDTTGGKIKIFAFPIGGTGENDLLRISAQATGGSYRPISSKELHAVGNP